MCSLFDITMINNSWEKQLQRKNYLFRLSFVLTSEGRQGIRVMEPDRRGTHLMTRMPWQCWSRHGQPVDGGFVGLVHIWNPAWTSSSHLIVHRRAQKTRHTLQLHTSLQASPLNFVITSQSCYEPLNRLVHSWSQVLQVQPFSKTEHGPVGDILHKS